MEITEVELKTKIFNLGGSMGKQKFPVTGPTLESYNIPIEYINSVVLVNHN